MKTDICRKRGGGEGPFLPPSPLKKVLLFLLRFSTLPVQCGMGEIVREWGPKMSPIKRGEGPFTLAKQASPIIIVSFARLDAVMLHEWGAVIASFLRAEGVKRTFSSDNIV